MSTVATFHPIAQDVTAEELAAAVRAQCAMLPTLADVRTRYVHLHNHADAPDVTAGRAYDALAAHVEYDDDDRGHAPVAVEDADGPLTVWALGASGGARESRHLSPGWAFYRAEQLTRAAGAWSVVVTDGDAVRATWDSVTGWAYAGADARGDRARVIAAESIIYDYR